MQGVEEAGVALPAALQVPHEGQRGAQQPVRVLAAAQQHRPGVGVQVLHCGTHTHGERSRRDPAPRGRPFPRTCEGDGAARQAVVPVHPCDGVSDGEAQHAVLDALPAPRVLRDHLAEDVPAGQRAVSGAAPARTRQRRLPPASPVLEAHHGGGGGARRGRTAGPANGEVPPLAVANGRRAGAGARGGQRGPASLHGLRVRGAAASRPGVTEPEPLRVEMTRGHRAHAMTSHHRVSQTTSGLSLNTSIILGSPFLCLIILSVKKFLLTTNLKFPWRSLTLSSSCPVAYCLEEKPDLYVTPVPFQVLLESDKVPPEPLPG